MKDIKFMNYSQIDKCFKKHKSFIDRIYLKYGFSREHYLGYVPLFLLPRLNHKKNVAKNIHYHLHQSMLQQRNIYEKNLLCKAIVSSSIPPITTGFNVQKPIDNDVTVQNTAAIFNSDFYQRVSRGYTWFVRKKVMQDSKSLLWLNNTTHRSSSYPSVSTNLKYDDQFTGSDLYSLQLNPSNNFKNQFTNVLAWYDKCYQIAEQSHMLFKSKQFAYLLNGPFLPGTLSVNLDVSLLNTMYESYHRKGISLQERRLLYTDTEDGFIKYAPFKGYHVDKIMSVLGGLLQTSNKHSPEYVVLQTELNLSSQLHDIKRYLALSHSNRDLEMRIGKSRIKATSYMWGQHKLSTVESFTNNISTSKSLSSNWNHFDLEKQQYGQTYSRFSDLSIADNRSKSMVIGQRSLFASIDNVSFKNAYFSAKQLTNIIALMREPASNANTIKSLTNQFTFFAQVKQQLNEYSSINRGLLITDRSGSTVKASRQSFTSIENVYFRNSQFARNQLTKIFTIISSLRQTRGFNQGALRIQGYYISQHRKSMSVKDKSLLFTNIQNVYFSNSLLAGRQLAKNVSFVGSLPQRMAENQGGLQTYKYDSHSLLRRYIIQINEMRRYLEILHLYPDFKKNMQKTMEEKSTRHWKPYKLLMVEKPADKAQYLAFIRHFNSLVLNKKHFNSDGSIFYRFYTRENHNESSLNRQWPSFTGIGNVDLKNLQVAGKQLDKVVSIPGSFPPRIAQNQQSLYTYVHNSHRLLRRNIIQNNEVKWYMEVLPLYPEFKKIMPNTTEEKYTKHQEPVNLLMLEKPVHGAQYLSLIKHFNNFVLNKKHFNSESPVLQSLYVHEHHRKSSLKGQWTSFTNREDVYFKNSQFTGRQLAIIANIAARADQINYNRTREIGTFTYIRNRLPVENYQHISDKQDFQIRRFYSDLNNLIDNSRADEANHHKEFHKLLISPENRINANAFSTYSSILNVLGLNRNHINLKDETTRQLFHLNGIVQNRSRLSEIRLQESARERFFQHIYNQPVQNQIFAETRNTANEFGAYNSKINVLGLNRNHINQKAETTRRLYHLNRIVQNRSRLSEIRLQESARERFFQHIYNQPVQNQIFAETRNTANEFGTYNSKINVLGLNRNHINQKAETTRRLYHLNRIVQNRSRLSEIRLQESARERFFQHIYNQPVQNQIFAETRNTANEFGTYSSIFSDLDLNRNRINQKAEKTRQLFHLNRIVQNRSMLSEIKLQESARKVLFRRIHNSQIQIQYRKAEPVDYITPQTIMTNYRQTFASYEKTASAPSFGKHDSKLGYKTSANTAYKEQFKNQLNGLILEFKRENRGRRESSTNEPANSQTITIQSDTEKVAVRLSNEQLDKIAVSLYKKFEKKIKFERQRSGIR